MRVGGKWAWAAAIFALAVIAGFCSWPLDPERVARALSGSAGPDAQWVWRRPASVRFTALPWPHLGMTGVALTSVEGASRLEAPDVDVALQPDKLLLGEIRPVTATLDKPTALIDLDSWSLARARRPPIGRVRARGGAVHIISAARGLDARIANLDGRFDWPKPTAALSFAFTAQWRGQPISADGAIDHPGQLSTGEPSPARLAIWSTDADFTFSGTWVRGATNEFEGDLESNVRARDAVRQWLGITSPPLIFAQQFGLRGKAIWRPGALDLSDAQMEIGAQKFEGSLNFTRAAAKIKVSGTLAADALDLTSVLGTRPALFDAAGEWSREAIVPRPSPMLDLDLRVSAAHAAWGGPAIDDAAASVLQHEGRLELKLLEASAYGGSLAGEIAIDANGEGARTRAALSLENVDCGALLQDWGVTSYSGRCGVQGEARAEGVTPAEIAASANGATTFDLQSGAVSGVNFEEALRRSRRRAIDIDRDMIVGQTKFASATARVAFADGEAQIAEARAQGPGAILEASGAIGLAARDWRTKILATQAGALGEASADSPRLGFTLSGTWSAPVLTTSGEE